MPRAFLYIVFVVFVALTAAFSYRLYQDERCCESRLRVSSDEEKFPAEGWPLDRMSSLDQRNAHRNAWGVQLPSAWAALETGYQS